MAGIKGTWEVIMEETKGMDEYGKAHGIPSEKIEMYKNLAYTINVSCEGDTWTVKIDMQGLPKQEYSYKLGEPFEYQSLDGSKPQLTVTVDGDTVTETYALPERQWKCIRVVEGDCMTATTTYNDATMIQKLKRV